MQCVSKVVNILHDLIVIICFFAILAIYAITICWWVDEWWVALFNARSVHDIRLQRRTVTSYCWAVCLLKLLMIKRGILLVPDIVFSARDIDNRRNAW